jgi:hypothetical protein
MNELPPFLPSSSANGYAGLLKKLEALHVESHSLCSGVHPFILKETFAQKDARIKKAKICLIFVENLVNS